MIAQPRAGQILRPMPAQAELRESLSDACRDEAARFHHLDALRGFALLLGVVFHAAASFIAHYSDWAIVDSKPSVLLEWFFFGCHSFRMELFFIMAGFFGRLLLLRRGTAGFVRNRIQRILIPLVAGWVLVYPLVIYLWLWGWSVSGRLAKMGVPDLPLWKLLLGFFASGGFLRKFDLFHLWFLHQLLVIYSLLLAVRWACSLAVGAGAQAVRLDRWFGRLCRWRAAALVFALLCLPMLLTMRVWGVDTPSSSLLPHLPTTFFFGFCFLVGWLLHRQPELVGTFERRWPWHLALGAGLWLWLGGALDRVPLAGLASKQVHSVRLAFTACYALTTWGFVLGFLGLFSRFCRRPNAWRRYLADASYWIYLVHAPLVVALQILVSRWALPWPVKYLFILAVAIPVLILSYHYLVRPSWIGLQLNGQCYPRRWPWATGHKLP